MPSDVQPSNASIPIAVSAGVDHGSSDECRHSIVSIVVQP